MDDQQHKTVAATWGKHIENTTSQRCSSSRNNTILNNINSLIRLP